MDGIETLWTSALTVAVLGGWSSVAWLIVKNASAKRAFERKRMRGAVAEKCL